MNHDEPQIGRLIEGGGGRDAIHVAIAPVTAGAELVPGSHVTLNDKGVAVPGRGAIGIVDPFLTVRCVLPGQRFYLFLYPKSVTSLRHVWTHPAFNEGTTDDEAWLRHYAATSSPYEHPHEAFETLKDGLRTGQLFFHGSDCHGLYDIENAGELKERAERYLGIEIDWEKFTFSCSC